VLQSVNKSDHITCSTRVASFLMFNESDVSFFFLLFFFRVCVFNLFVVVFCVSATRQILFVCFDTKLWGRHGRATRRASGRAADRARPRGLSDGAGGPVQRRDEPRQQGGPAAVLSAHEDEETTGLLLQAAGLPRPLQTSMTDPQHAGP